MIVLNLLACSVFGLPSTQHSSNALSYPRTTTAELRDRLEGRSNASPLLSQSHDLSHQRGPVNNNDLTREELIALIKELQAEEAEADTAQSSLTRSRAKK